MARVKAILKKAFFLPPTATVLVSVPSFAMVIFVLVAGVNSPLSYAAYALSAYALIVTVTGLSKIIASIRSGIERWPLYKIIQSCPLVQRLVGDVAFRSEITLHGGSLIGFIYAAMNLISGILYRSVWFIVLAVYYSLLSAMRGMLSLYMHRMPLGSDIHAEYRRCRGCGVLLLIMNVALIGMVRYISHYNRGATYPGLIIYVMAAYTFYITTAAVINAIRYRRHGSPILSSAKAISLTAALVSMLSLENAMIAQFGDDSTFRRSMTSAFGGLICVAVLAMATFMIIRANKKLRQLNDPKTNL